MGHVLARVSGYGWTVVPFFPYRFRRVDADARALRVERTGATNQAATISFASGAPQLDSAVGDLTASSFAGDFRVETGLFTVGWPAGFDIFSSQPGGPSAFDFVRSDGSLLYVQGPMLSTRMPKLEAMAAAGQHIVDRGTHSLGEWVELAYEHGGRKYWQRHTTVRWASDTSLAITAQSPEEHAAKTRAAAVFVVENLEPC